MRILTISGSLRAASSNTALLHELARVAPSGVEVSLYEGLATIPPFSPDLDEQGMTPPAPVAELRRAIAHAHAVVISSPEYAHGVPGVLKNALDWLVSSDAVISKPFALISAARATFATAQLTETLRTMSVNLVGDAVVVPMGAKPSDESVRAQLRTAVDALARAT